MEKVSKNKQTREMKLKKLLLLMICVGLSACTVIGPGKRGVRIMLGSTGEEEKQPGAYLWFPVILGMARLDVQIQKSEIKTGAASKDMQEIQAEIAVNWSLNPKKVVEIYRTIGDEDAILDRIIVPAVNEVMKAATARRTAEEVLTKRLDLKADIDEGLKERLEKNGLSFQDVNIVNIKFSKDFEEAIESKQIAEQKAKQAEYDALKAIQEAKAEVNRAKGRAEAQQLLKSSITSELLQQRAIEKWDGHFPQVMGQGSMPFINIKMEK